MVGIIDHPQLLLGPVHGKSACRCRRANHVVPALNYVARNVREHGQVRRVGPVSLGGGSAMRAARSSSFALRPFRARDPPRASIRTSVSARVGCAAMKSRRSSDPLPAALVCLRCKHLNLKRTAGCHHPRKADGQSRHRFAAPRAAIRKASED